MSGDFTDFSQFARLSDWSLTREEKLEAKIEQLCASLAEARGLLSAIAGAVKDGEQRMPVGVHGGRGVARYLTAAFVQKCADWCAQNK